MPQSDTRDLAQVSLKTLFLQHSENVNAEIKELGERFERSFNELETRIERRMHEVTTAIADLRVQLAQFQVLGVRVDALETTAARIEKRHGADIQIVLNRIQSLSDEIGANAIALSETQSAFAQTRAQCAANTTALEHRAPEYKRKQDQDLIKLVIRSSIITALAVAVIMSLLLSVIF